MSNEKILVVVSKDSLVVLESLLNQWEFEAVIADNSVEALSLSLASPPDLLVTEVGTPGIDAVELCRSFKRTAHLRLIPIIAVTEVPRLPFALHGLVEAIFQKPFDPESLRNAIGFYVWDE
jgi:two-component system, sensor histidine kinase and response regulator